MQTHKIFISWLTYLIVVLIGACGLIYLGIPQIALASDHSHLTTFILTIYVFVELFSARQAWLVSKENIIAVKTMKWFQDKKLEDISFAYQDEIVVLTDGKETFIVPTSETSTHITSLRDLAVNNSQIDQTILLDVLDDKLHSKVSVIEFVAGRIVWIGILATIAGVILAFWPLLSAGISTEAIRLKLGGFFSGIAVAFIPTAASFVFKISLDISTKILSTGSAETLNILATLGETKIIPFLKRAQ